MEGFFDDAGWAVLGHESADESEANKYEGRLYWKYHDVLEDGSLGTEKEEEEYFDFLSYTYSCNSHSADEENQVISDGSHISDCITRKFVVKPNEKAVVTKAYQRYFENPSPLGRHNVSHKHGTNKHQDRHGTLRKDLRIISQKERRQTR